MRRLIAFVLTEEENTRADEITLQGLLDGKVGRGDYAEMATQFEPSVMDLEKLMELTYGNRDNPNR